MGVMVYKKEDGQLKAARINHKSIEAYTKAGWSLTKPKRGIKTPEEPKDTALTAEQDKIDNNKENLNLANVRMLAKEKGIKDWDKKVPELLVKELKEAL